MCRALAILLFFCTSACGTIHAVTGDGVGLKRVPGPLFPHYLEYGETVPRVFAGVWIDSVFIARGRQPGWHAVDLPLSLVADVVLLPYTLVTQLACGSYRSERGLPPRVSLGAFESVHLPGRGLLWFEFRKPVGHVLVLESGNVSQVVPIRNRLDAAHLKRWIQTGKPPGSALGLSDDYIEFVLQTSDD